MRRGMLALAAWAGIVGAMLYSSFLLAWPLGSRLSTANSFVSELGVRGQPASIVFRSADLVAGLLIAMFALALLWYLRPHTAGALGCLCLAGVGLASVADALDPMPCTPSTSVACRHRLDDVAIVLQLHQRHTLSSVAGVLVAAASMLLLGQYLRTHRQWQGLGRVGLASAAVLGSFGGTEVLLTSSGRWVGMVERAHVLLISTWIAALGWRLFRDRHTYASVSPTASYQSR